MYEYNIYTCTLYKHIYRICTNKFHTVTSVHHRSHSEGLTFSISTDLQSGDSGVIEGTKEI